MSYAFFNVLFSIIWGTYCGQWAGGHDKDLSMYFSFGALWSAGQLILQVLFLDQLSLFWLVFAVIGGVFFSLFLTAVKEYA